MSPNPHHRRLTCLTVVAGIALALLPALPAYAVTRDVTTFGATGGDTTNDRVAIQNAINASSSGDIVFFPAGTFYINDALQAKTGVRLNGASKTTAIIKYSGTVETEMIGTPDSPSVNNVEISNLTLDGNNDPQADSGIGFINGSGHNFHDLIIKNFPGTNNTFGPFGIHFIENVDNSRIANNQITNIGPAREFGGGIRLSWGSTNNKVLTNTIATTGRGGIFANDGSTGQTVKGNTVTGSGGEGLGIELWGGSGNSVVEDNVVDHWISLQDSPYTAVRRNTVRDTTGPIKFIGLEAAETSNNVFTDNLVSSGQQIGISVSGETLKQHIYWAHNTVEDQVQWGAQIQGETDAARYQYFYDNEFTATQDDNPNAEYPADDGHGFRFNFGPNTHITLDSNQITNNGQHGIQITPDAAVNALGFVNNTITGNGGASITGHPGAAAAPDLQWSGNTVSGNGTNTQLTSRGFANAKPTANFTAPATGSVGVPVSFTNTSTDPGGSIAFSLWDFNHGVPVSTTSPSHTFDAPGTYRVTLVVWDNGGRGARIAKNITIS